MSLPLEELHLLPLNVGLAIHDADWNWKNVNSPFMRLYYVTEGTAKVELPAGTFLLKPNHLYLIPAFVPHSYICDSSFCHYYLHIYEESHQDVFAEWELPFEIPATEVDLRLVTRLCEINPDMKLPQSDPTAYDNEPTLIKNVLKNKQRAFCDKLESRGIVFLLVSRFVRQAQQKCCCRDKRIEDVLSYVREHIYENINLSLLADQVCLSKDHFIRLFKHEMGVTPLHYINQKKIEKAQFLLLTEDSSVKNVAFTMGFDDYSYFNRLFKKLVGTTPQEYRRTCH